MAAITNAFSGRVTLLVKALNSINVNIISHELGCDARVRQVSKANRAEVWTLRKAAWTLVWVNQTDLISSVYSRTAAQVATFSQSGLPACVRVFSPVIRSLFSFLWIRSSAICRPATKHSYSVSAWLLVVKLVIYMVSTSHGSSDDCTWYRSILQGCVCRLFYDHFAQCFHFDPYLLCIQIVEITTSFLQ